MLAFGNPRLGLDRMPIRNVSTTLRHWLVEFSVAWVAEIPGFVGRLAG
jgi:hypothetical protein